MVVSNIREGRTVGHLDSNFRCSLALLTTFGKVNNLHLATRSHMVNKECINNLLLWYQMEVRCKVTTGAAAEVTWDIRPQTSLAAVNPRDDVVAGVPSPSHQRTILLGAETRRFNKVGNSSTSSTQCRINGVAADLLRKCGRADLAGLQDILRIHRLHQYKDNQWVQ